MGVQLKGTLVGSLQLCVSAGAQLRKMDDSLHKRRGKKKKFGATAPPILDYLKEILRRYPDGGQILKELIQNADDAEAREVVFVYDERNYGTQSLWVEDLDKFQGPALFTYNNAVFTEEDWKGIQNMGRSIKLNDPNKVGRFGIGFSSVYHITDLPCIFSGPNIGILDPQGKYFDDGRTGWIWSLDDQDDQEMLQALFDQFHPLRNLLEELEVSGTSWNEVLKKEYFPGTIFRFPLRNQPSEISENLYNTDRVFDLFNSFQADAEMSLLFLKSVTSLSLKYINRAGEGKELLKVSITDHYRGSSISSEIKDLNLANSIDSVSSEKYLELRRHSEKASSCRWLVTNCSLKERGLTKLHSLAKKLSYNPSVGLAFPLDQSVRKGFEGRLSCFLPLPDNETNRTGLPVHTNACFGLTDNRRYVKWKEIDQKHDEAAEWNEQLVSKLLPFAYLQLVMDAIALSKNSSQSTSMVFDLWPNLDVLKYKERWVGVVECILKDLMNLKVLCLVANESVWIKPSEATYLPPIKDPALRSAVEDLLLTVKEPLVKVPSHVFNAIDSICEFTLKMVSPALVCHILHNCDLSIISSDQKLLLLEYVLQEECYHELKGLQLLPLSDGSFATFQDQCKGEVFIESNELPRLLLPGLLTRFLYQGLRPATHEQIVKLAKK
ncbi:sacsin-like, partial [Latimeria chalumnae]